MQTQGLRKCGFILLAGIIILNIALMGKAQAASDTKDLTIRAEINAKAKLTISPTSINFPDADPDDTPSIPASAPLAVTAKARTGSSSMATLKVLSTNLSNGTDTINISNVHWTSTSPGFVTSGTLSSSAAQDVASWTGSGIYTGTLNFTLDNRWDYPTGDYTATATYTLTAP